MDTNHGTYTIENKENRNIMRPSSAMKKNKINLPEQQGDLEEYIEILYDHQKSCQNAGKYVEAEMAKRRLQELRAELEKRNKDEMKQRHTGEKDEIEKAHMAEFNEFNEFWDKKMMEFNEEALRVEAETQQRHGEELRNFQEDLEKTIPLKPKDTTELLNMRKVEQSLAMQEEYMEAHKVQQRIMQIEKEEYEKWSLQRNKKVSNLIQQLKQKQQNELNALKQRILSGQEEQNKIRSQELEKLLQKYTNVRKELESSQLQEVNKLDKSVKGSTMNQSKMQSSRISSASIMKSNKVNYC